MTIRNEAELQGLRRAGAVVSAVLRSLGRCVEPGITTAEIDALCARELTRRDAEPTPARLYGFPGSLCVSVNDEAVHGVPSARRLRAGDLVKLDLVASVDGFVADAAVTVVIPPVTPVHRRLVRSARRALESAVQGIRAGLPIRSLGRLIERSVNRDGFHVIPELGGHGVGRAIHEPPAIPNLPDASSTGSLHEGLVIAVEPIITSGSGRVVEAGDGWTLRTLDGAFVAHHEHTLVVTRGEPIVVTA